MSASQTSKICFVIAPIGEEGSATRKRSDQVLEHIIEKVVPNFGYTPVRADRISDPGIITSQIIQHVVDDDLVIVDMTDRNPNVFYELAVRHAIRKPTVHLIDVDQTIPFDVAGVRVIQVNVHDLDSVEHCRQEIANQIRSIESRQTHSDFESPISVAINLQQLQRSSNPVNTGIADIKVAVSSLSAEIGSIQTQLRAVNDLPRMSSFSGSGSGTFSHGLGMRPDLIILHSADGGPITYDSVTDSTVHVELLAAPTTFSGIAVAIVKPQGVVSQQPVNAIAAFESKALPRVRTWLQFYYPDCTLEDSHIGRLDFILTRPGGTEICVQVKFVQDLNRLRRVLADQYYLAEREQQREHVLMLIGTDQIAMDEIKQGISRLDLHKSNVTFHVGLLHAGGDLQII